MNTDDLLNIINNDKLNIVDIKSLLNSTYGIVIMSPRSNGKTAFIRKMKTRINMINISINMIKDGMY